MNWTPAKDLAARRALCITLETSPYIEPREPCRNDWCHGDDLRVTEDGEEYCLSCEKAATDSLADFVGSGGMDNPANRPLDARPLIPDDPNVCPRCGAYGSMKHGDERDCRSADCMGDKVDAAEAMMEDR